MIDVNSEFGKNNANSKANIYEKEVLNNSTKVLDKVFSDFNNFISIIANSDDDSVKQLFINFKDIISNLNKQIQEYEKLGNNGIVIDNLKDYDISLIVNFFNSKNLAGETNVDKRSLVNLLQSLKLEFDKQLNTIKNLDLNNLYLTVMNPNNDVDTQSVQTELLESTEFNMDKENVNIGLLFKAIELIQNKNSNFNYTKLNQFQKELNTENSQYRIPYLNVFDEIKNKVSSEVFSLINQRVEGDISVKDLLSLSNSKIKEVNSKTNLKSIDFSNLSNLSDDNLL